MQNKNKKSPQISENSKRKKTPRQSQWIRVPAYWLQNPADLLENHSRTAHEAARELSRNRSGITSGIRSQLGIDYTNRMQNNDQ